MLACGRFVVPKTRLAMLPLTNEFTKDHQTVAAHVRTYGKKDLPHVMSKLVEVRILHFCELPLRHHACCAHSPKRALSCRVVG
jgi:hypothetical protein